MEEKVIVFYDIYIQGRFYIMKRPFYFLHC